MTASFFAPQRNNSKIPAKRMLAPNLDDQEGLGKGLSRTVPQVRYAKTRSATAAPASLLCGRPEPTLSGHSRSRRRTLQLGLGVNRLFASASDSGGTEPRPVSP